MLEQIRLLTNLETNEHKLLQMIMIGQPELRDLLAQPGLRQLSQRITARYHLGPLSREETARYVRHRLSIAGCSRGQLFPPATIRKVYRLSRGIPRLINVICDRALLGAYVQGKDRVDPQTLKQAAREATGQDGAPGTRSAVYRTSAALLLLLAALLTGAFLFWYRPWTGPQPVSVTASPSPQSKTPAMATKTPAVPRTGLVWPGDLRGEQTQRSAYGTLLKLWQIEVKPGAPCEQAGNRGLRCLQGRGSLVHLHQMNKPAMLTLVDEKKGPFYATLINLQGKAATMVLGPETRVVDLEEINRTWSGEYLLLWRVPPDFQGEVKPGSREPMVVWLKRQLALARGRTPQIEKDPVYDPATVREVKRFQLSAGLDPDGIVGPVTIMLLNSTTDSGDPVLHGGEGKR